MIRLIFPPEVVDAHLIDTGTLLPQLFEIPLTDMTREQRQRVAATRLLDPSNLDAKNCIDLRSHSGRTTLALCAPTTPEDWINLLEHQAEQRKLIDKDVRW